MQRLLGGAIDLLSSAVGLAAFLYPFLAPSLATGGVWGAHASDAALVTSGLVALALVALVVDAQGQVLGAKTVTTLGVLVALTSVLRFFALTLPGLGGISPVFAPILLAGYVFGARFGFLLGAFSLLVSALITGGVGPWLPYQMYAAGWAGMTAGWLGSLLRRVERPRLEIAALGLFGFGWGIAFGVIMNVYFWPFAAGPSEQSWAPGTSIADTIARYAVFYVATSLWWDLARAVGNVVLILLLGVPMLRALTRFRRRFYVELDRPYRA